MSAHLFVKLAEQPISQPPSSLHPIDVKPATGFAGKALNLAGNAAGRVGRLASGVMNTAAAGGGRLVGRAADAVTSTANSLAPASMKKYTAPWAASTGDFVNSMTRAGDAGMKDIGSAFAYNPSPSASQANMAQNAQWLDQSKQPGLANVTRTLYGVGDGAAQAIPGSAALGGVGAALSKAQPIAGAATTLAGKATNVLKNPLATSRNVAGWGAGQGANMYAATSYVDPAMTAAQYGVDQLGLGSVSDATSKMYGNLAKTPVVGPIAQVGAAIAPSLAPGPLKPFARALQIGSMSPFAVQPDQRIDATTGEMVSTQAQVPPEAMPPGAAPADASTPEAPVSDYSHVPPSPAPEGEPGTPPPADFAQPTPAQQPADALQPANPTPADATRPANVPAQQSSVDISKMFSNLATQWGKMDPRMQMALLAGAGISLVGLSRGNIAVPLVGLALSGGLAAHQGLFGEQAKNMTQGFGKTVSDMLFKPVTNQAGGAGAKSTAAPAANTGTAPLVKRMRTEAAKGDDAAARQLEKYQAANPQEAQKFKQLDSGLGKSDWAASNYLSSDPQWKGVTTQDITNLRRIRERGKQMGLKITHNIPAANLDAIDTIRNNVNVNGNFPAQSFA